MIVTVVEVEQAIYHLRSLRSLRDLQSNKGISITVRVNRWGCGLRIQAVKFIGRPGRETAVFPAVVSLDINGLRPRDQVGALFGALETIRDRLRVSIQAFMADEQSA